MTYKQLLKQLLSLNLEQLDMDVTIFCVEENEFFPVDNLLITSQGDDILDKDHPYLIYYKEEKECGM